MAPNSSSRKSVRSSARIRAARSPTSHSNDDPEADIAHQSSLHSSSTSSQGPHSIMASSSNSTLPPAAGHLQPPVTNPSSPQPRLSHNQSELNAHHHVKTPPYRTMGELIKAIQTMALQNWEEHYLTPEEFHALNLASATRLAKIRTLEDAQMRVAPERDLRIEKMLLISRIDYNTRFWLTFRMNDLPSEIITNIFRYVVWASPEPRTGVLWRLWLTWVCKSWRTIALEDSTLWSAIWFRDLPPFGRSLAWFDRAGDTPLDIRINDSRERKFTDREMGELMDKLCAKITTIRILIIILEEWEPVLTVLDKLRSATNSNIPLTIERFELHRSGSPYLQIGDGYQPSFLRQPLPLFGGASAPRLRYFSINGVHIDWQQSFLSNLTTLDLRRMPLERSPGLIRFRDILTKCPGLLKLCLDGAGPQWHPEDPCELPPVHLLKLKIFIIADVSLHYGLYVLSHIHAPNVLDLTVMNLVGEDYSPLFGAMATHFPKVRLLTIYSVESASTVQSGRAIIKWLDSMPLLSYLRVANIKSVLLNAFLYNPESFLPVLHSTPPSTCIICPKITILEFNSMDAILVGNWGCERRRIGAPLEKIYITKENASKLTSAEQQKLSEAAVLAFMEYGGITPEEEEIQRA